MGEKKCPEGVWVISGVAGEALGAWVSLCHG